MNLMRFKKLYFGISLLVLIPGFISLLVFGLKPAIDFTGGSLLEIKFEDPELFANFDENKFQEEVSDFYQIGSIQSSGEDQLIFKGKELTNEEKDQVIEQLLEDYGLHEVLRFENVGPTLGKELLKKTLTALFLVAAIITIYVWKQFDELKYGVSAVLAMLHDSLVLIGIFSILGHFMGVEVDVLFVTALLTTLSFSIHDTVVVYDRIRELKKKNPRYNLEEVANVAVLETLGRSINNSITIIVMLLSLVILGGESIHWFAVALLMGAITGTYSSTFTAVPLLLVWDERAKKKH
jgi:preprotein translocase subunit SecF